MGVAEAYLHFLYFGMGYSVQILAGDMIPYGHVEEAIGLIILLFSKFIMNYILA